MSTSGQRLPAKACQPLNGAAGLVTWGRRIEDSSDGWLAYFQYIKQVLYGIGSAPLALESIERVCAMAGT
ncbi:protein of unknown function (plasmid) [Pararobbsia alpina]